MKISKVLLQQAKLKKQQKATSDEPVAGISITSTCINYLRRPRKRKHQEKSTHPAIKHLAT